VGWVSGRRCPIPRSAAVCYPPMPPYHELRTVGPMEMAPSGKSKTMDGNRKGKGGLFFSGSQDRQSTSGHMHGSMTVALSADQWPCGKISICHCLCRRRKNEAFPWKFRQHTARFVIPAPRASEAGRAKWSPVRGYLGPEPFGNRWAPTPLRLVSTRVRLNFIIGDGTYNHSQQVGDLGV
jgi:hypothetical protein